LRIKHNPCRFNPDSDVEPWDVPHDNLSDSFTTDIDEQAYAATRVEENTPEFFTSLKQNADVLNVRWCNEPGIPRNLVNCLVEGVTRFMGSGSVLTSKNDVLSVLSEAGADP